MDEHLHSRRGLRDSHSYAVAALTYVLLGLAWQPALNWVVGPIWIVAVVWLLAGRDRT